jgi:2-polyprenyl-3-methyl-5-hydroxy-6-metoxy-1,4-benzoquinol methylase
MERTDTIREQVREYYGKVLTNRDDLKTGACCSSESLPPAHREVLGMLDEDILNRFYGCGSPIPPAIENCTVLDLGCGSGRDVYLASYLVGAGGSVIGIDMTEEQLVVARRHVHTQTVRFGYETPNVDFRLGTIEDLAAIGIADNSIDVVISNCVINLSPDKERVLAEVFRVLKPGGELYFSDIFASRRVPISLRTDPVLHGECLGGAMYIEDFRRLLRKLGCLDYRVVSNGGVPFKDPAIKAKVGMIDFHSMTIRAFNLGNLEDICEDYGQTATYLGTMAGYRDRFALDDHHLFITGRPMRVCGNTAAMVRKTRFSRHFRVEGDTSVHQGSFDCDPATKNDAEGNHRVGSSCC